MQGCLCLCPNYRIAFFLFAQDLRDGASQKYILHMPCEDIWCSVPKILFHQADIKVSAGCVQKLKAIGFKQFCF